MIISYEGLVRVYKLTRAYKVDWLDSRVCLLISTAGGMISSRGLLRKQPWSGSRFRIE